MFDWDRDFDDVVRHRQVTIKAKEKHAPVAKQWYWRALASRVVLPAVAAIGLMGAGFFVNQWIGSATATTHISAASFGGVALRGAAAPTMPDTLQVYDQEGFDRFMAGMARINDGDLVQYMHSTQRDLRDGSGVMAPYLHDVLVLTRLEMHSRGLIQPRRSQDPQTAAAAPMNASDGDGITTPATGVDSRRAALILEAAAPLARDP